MKSIFSPTYIFSLHEDDAMWKHLSQPSGNPLHVPEIEPEEGILRWVASWFYLKALLVAGGHLNCCQMKHLPQFGCLPVLYQILLLELWCLETSFMPYCCTSFSSFTERCLKSEGLSTHPIPSTWSSFLPHSLLQHCHIRSKK